MDNIMVDTKENIVSNNKITVKQACEHIVAADILITNDGSIVKAEDVFNYSPTGELYMISIWYKMACRKLGCTPLG